MKSDATFVSANVRLRKNCIGSIGDGARSSQATNAATSSAPTTIGTTMPALVQPCVVAAHEAPDDAEQPGAREPEARAGRAPRRRPCVSSSWRARERREHEPDRDVEPEDPVPRDAADDRAADERAERDREAADAAPDAEREPAPLRPAPPAERIVSVSGVTIAPPTPCTRARDVERVRGRRERGDRRRAGEEQQAEHEHAPAAEAVAERGAREEQHREGERVRVDRPLELRDRRVQVAPDHRQRRRHDEVVEARP